MAAPSLHPPTYRRRGLATPEELSASPLVGVHGLLASLLVGILLNIPVRVGEFLAAVPVVGAAPPPWFTTLYRLMLADTLLLSSAYALAFAAAMRRAPLFPPLLALVWTADIAMQLVIAHGVAGAGPLPPAVSDALLALLEGNMKKVLVSVAIWLPYLICSRRVNATYRRRLPR